MIKPYLRIIKQNFAAGQDFAKLPLNGNFLRVLASKQPVTFVLGDESTVELVPGMGVFLGEDQAFKELRITRADKAAEEAVQIAVGWQPADKPIVLTDNRAVADISNKLTIEDARSVIIGSAVVIPPPIRSRFVPRFTATNPVLGGGRYLARKDLGPLIVANKDYVLGPLALKDKSVLRRVVRLTSGAAVKVGFGEVSVDPSVTGNVWELTTANPERTIEGCETLIARAETADGDAALTVQEILQDTGDLTDIPLVYHPTLTPAQLAVFGPARLKGSITWTYTKSTSGLTIDSGFDGTYGGITPGAWNPGNSYDATGTPSGTMGIADTGAGTIAGTGAVGVDALGTLAYVPSIAPQGDHSLFQAPQTSYLCFRIMCDAGSASIATTTGQAFSIPVYLSTNWDVRRKFRFAIPWDGSAPYMEQLRGDKSGWDR